ncbi:PREDICTED: uncharacterized protein LOC104813188 isoform X2 [Tarenaya hassleriana]|uniref:uncharacterized protein LOC104813188 isoform X2 n=1 Tax=Tarenaya hassleriana TaxID=28532 RepID=UPI00053C24C4|nr:PREDICTED: uncharacterized protein LOC104813188 isoform X2 [Tarenaya hassleriana]
MGALAPVTPWIPEDDLLLRNAIEAGASLESLAKGAVRFSRRFTIRELHDRWHSLLYDPDVSTEASFHMAELERSNPSIPTKFGRTGNSKEVKSSSGKRNAEKVRLTYYSLRKKFRLEPFNSMDLGFLVPPNDNHFICNGDAAHLGLEESHMDIIHNAFPEILVDGGCMGGFNNPIEDSHPVPEDNLPGEIPHVMAGDLAFTQNAGSSGCDAVHHDSKMKLETAVHEPKTATPSTDCFLAELSNSLFNDVDPFMDVEGDAGLGDCETPELDGTNATSSSVVKPVSDSLAVDPHPEVVNGVICCVLNTEEPEIPCNGDLFPSNNCHPMSVSSLARRNFKDSSNPVSTSVRDLSASKERSIGYSAQMPKKNPGRSQASFRGKTEMSQPSQGTEYKEFPKTESHNATPRATAINSGGSAYGISAQTCSNTQSAVSLDGNSTVATIKHIPGKPSMGSDGHGKYPKKDIGNSTVEQGILAVDNLPHTDDGSIEMIAVEPEVNPTVDEHLDYSDEELPNYSDIEAMILDMDLDPGDQDMFELEVSKYQNEETKRAIIRLEQAAYSYMQRAIASHGAFAILYGRRSKHYIKKPEVLLGRSTEDLVVDIDLGREKRGSKISRRQAIIRLGEDGSFHMKNLGKYPVSINEKEVDPGQSLILKSDCLIEIRGMPFIFETNQACINQYLDSNGKV